MNDEMTQTDKKSGTEENYELSYSEIIARSLEYNSDVKFDKPFTRNNVLCFLGAHDWPRHEASIQWGYHLPDDICARCGQKHHDTIRSSPNGFD